MKHGPRSLTRARALDPCFCRGRTTRLSSTFPPPTRSVTGGDCSVSGSLTGRRAEGGVGRLPGVPLRASSLFLISELDLESRNKVSVGEPAEGSLTGSPRRQPTVPPFHLSAVGLGLGASEGPRPPRARLSPSALGAYPPSGAGDAGCETPASKGPVSIGDPLSATCQTAKRARAAGRVAWLRRGRSGGRR